MPRATASAGPLSLAAFPGARSVLLTFGAEDGEGEGAGLLNERGLHGFVLRREQLKGGSSKAAVVWLADKRSGGLGSSSAATGTVTDPSGGAAPDDADGDDDDLEIGPALGTSGGDVSSSSRKPRTRWSWALKHPIRDFKWGDYVVEPDAEYRYTLFAVGGDPGADGAGSGGSGGAADESDSPAPPEKGPGLHVFAQVAVRVVTPPLYGGQHEVHFNRGVTGQRFARLFPTARSQSSRSAEQWSWLSRGLEEALLHFIESAKGPGWKLRGALYEAHYVPVVHAIADARRRGVDVQLVVDWKIGSWSEDRRVWTQRGPQHLNMWAMMEAGLLNEGGCLHPRTKPLSAISHNKFFVLVDPGDEAVAVWTGSTNLTSGAIFGHSNVGHVVRDRAICKQYLAYWERLKVNPEKKELAVLNEEESPLPIEDTDLGPGGLGSSEARVLFSPRLRWAAALDFFAQLVLGARQCVAFTAAFGISKELAPALLDHTAIPMYLLLEGEGNWQASRDTVRRLKARRNVRVAFGTHIDSGQVESSEGAEASGGWLPETLTGLNQHVKYVHTKILLVDPFSDCPIVVSGSANFSKASMESNDENMLVVRGNRDLADAYASEFFRIFEHMRFRNEIEAAEEAKRKRSGGGGGEALFCKCGNVAPPRICQKEGPNRGRRFRCCSKPRDKQCGFFVWIEDEEAEASVGPDELAWPLDCFDAVASPPNFATLERRMFADLGAGRARPSSASSAKREDDEEGPIRELVRAMSAIGLVGDDASPSSPSQPPSHGAPKGEGRGDSTSSEVAAIASPPAAVPAPAPAAGASPSAAAAAAAPFPAELVATAIKAATSLLEVDSSSKPGLELYRAAREALALAVGALPEQPARTEVFETLEQMDGSFVARLKRSWRPFLITVLRCLGENPTRVTELSRQHRLGMA